MNYLFEKNNMNTADTGLFTPADTLRKVPNAAEHSFRTNASSLVISTALRFKHVKKMIHATHKKKLSHGLPEGKCHLVYVALNLYANIRLHHHIKGLSQRKNGKPKTFYSSSPITSYHGISKRLFFYYLISLLKVF